MLATLVRIMVAVVPIAASLGFVFFVSRVVPAPAGSLYAYLAWWLGLCAASTGFMIVIDKAARRCLPLGALLKLSLVFPDQAPSRFKVALRSGTTTKLQRIVEDAKAGRVGETPAEAAERVLELVAALNAHDRITRGHSERVRAYTQMIAEELKLDEREIDLLHWAGLLHDIGKLEVPYEILNKTSRPTEEEWEILKRHPEAGAALVAPLNDWLGEWVRAVGEHHERWDGTGYPAGLSGTDISFAARIVSVADVFDVITSARSYKAPIDPKAARAEIAECSGTQFDPAVVRAFLNISLGRLRFAMGPLSLFAGGPIGGISIPPVIGATVSGLAVGAASVVGSVFAAPTPSPAYGARTEAAVASKAAPRRVANPTKPPTVVGVPPTSDAPVDPIAPEALPDASPFPDSPPDSTAPSALTAPNVAAQIDEDTPTVVPLQGLDLVGLQSLAITSNPAGAAASAPEGAVLVSPPHNFYGEIGFGYEACWSLGCAPGTLTVTVRGVEDPPVVQRVSITVSSGQLATVDPLLNASDPDGDPLTLTGVGSPQFGSAAVMGGAVVYTAPAQFGGTDLFTFTVADPSGVTASEYIVVSVVSSNTAPSFVAGPDQSGVEDGGPRIVPAWATTISPGPPGESGQTVAFITTNDNAGLFSTPPAVATDGTLTYLPAPNAFGSATVSVAAVDSGGGNNTSAVQTFTLNVTPVNDAPSFAAGADQRVRESSSARSVAGWATGIRAGPANEVGQGVSFSVTNDNGALFSTPPAIAADGGLTYTPTPYAFGTATVTVVAIDSGGTALGGVDTSGTQNFTITVVPVPPRPQLDAYTVDQDTPLTVAAPGLLTNDFDGLGLPLTVQTAPVTSPTNGVVTLGSDGSFVYTPNPGFVGTDSFVYLVDDGHALSATATVTITVNSGVTAGSFYLGTSGSSATNYALTTTPPPGAAPVPDFDADGDPGLTLKSSGGAESETDPRRFHLWTYVAPSPIALDGPVTLDLWSTVEDFDVNKLGNPFVWLYDCAGGGTACVKLAGTELRARVWNNGPTWTNQMITVGSVTHTIAAGRELRVRLMERRNDLWVAMTAAYPSRLEVTLGNVAPIANADTYPVLEDASPTNLAVLANDVDTNLDATTVLITTPPTLGAAAVLGDGTLDYTPTANANGADSFSYQVCDTVGLCSSSTVGITIVAVNDAPTFGLSSPSSVSLPLPVSVPGFATAISVGPADESSQPPSFTVTNDDPGLFAVQPGIAPDGTLTYWGSGLPGSATVTVVMRDSGGTANGGVDVSSAQTFTILIL